MSGLTALAAAWIAMSAPLAAGTTPSHVVIMVAPYAGTVTSTGSSWAVSGCAHATVAVKPIFHPSTGKGALAVRSAATTACANPASSASSASAYWYTTVPVAITHKTSTVSVVEQVTAWVSAHITAVNCTTTVNISTNYAYCDEYASSSVYLDTYVEDLTTGATWFSGNGSFLGLTQYAYADKYCYNGTCYSYVSSTTFANQRSVSSLVTINVSSANVADSFAVFWEVYGISDSGAYLYHASMPGASGTSVVNVGTHGNGAGLSSITIA